MTTDVVALTQKLIQTEGLSGQEGAVADVVEETMKTLGFRDVSRDEYGNVVGRVGPPGNRTALLFDGHMDVVPVTGEWTVDPFGAEIIDGRLFGRGSTDMKGGLAAAICGVASAAASGELVHEVAVSASVMEETIEGVALGSVLDELNPRMVVICEPSSLSIKTGQRGRIECLLRVTGKPSHAAHPDKGINPIDLSARGLEALREMTLPRQEGFGDAILVATDIITDPYPSISLIPNSATIRFDRRILPGETVDSVFNAMQDVLDNVDPHAFSLSVSRDPIRTFTDKEVASPRFLPAWEIDAKHDLVQAAKSSVTGAGCDVKTGVYGFCTNGSESAGQRNIPTIGIGPGNESDAHIIDESVSIEELKKAATIYEQLSLQLAGKAMS